MREAKAHLNQNAHNTAGADESGRRKDTRKDKSFKGARTKAHEITAKKSNPEIIQVTRSEESREKS
jgi:hypothetical protein